MLAAGGHFWNSGMFLFRADRILAELGTHAAPILAAVTSAFEALKEVPGGAFEVPLDLYEAVPAQPIDKAVMEQSDRIAVVPCDPGWSDLGSWQALWEQLPKDAAGNAVQGDVLLDDSRGLPGPRRAAAGRLLRRPRSCRDRDRRCDPGRRSRPQRWRSASWSPCCGPPAGPRATPTPRSSAPGAASRSCTRAPAFKVKEIIVAPGGRLSLQSHKHRAEHWVVVAGTAKVTVDDQILLLEPNQSVHIPLGARHRMENPGAVPMHLIEVQCGDYLGEDDIIRYEDVYGRS